MREFFFTLHFFSLSLSHTLTHSLTHLLPPPHLLAPPLAHSLTHSLSQPVLAMEFLHELLHRLDAAAAPSLSLLAQLFRAMRKSKVSEWCVCVCVCLCA